MDYWKGAQMYSQFIAFGLGMFFGIILGMILIVLAISQKGERMEECYRCGFYDSDYGCTCPELDEWFACPIESQKPENQKELEEYAKWVNEKRG